MRIQKKSLEEKGITLVALVVTIIVLLILAGITISMVVGNNGLISKSKTARDIYVNVAQDERNMFDSVTGEIGQIDGTQEVANPAENGTIITDETEKAKIATVLEVNYNGFDVMKITSPSNVLGKFYSYNADQLGLFKMSYNYHIKFVALKKINGNYVKVNGTVSSYAHCYNTSSLDKLSDQNMKESISDYRNGVSENYTFDTFSNIDYPTYSPEEPAGDYESRSIEINQNLLNANSGILYVVMICEAENFPGYSIEQVGQTPASTGNGLSLISNLTY